MLGFLPRHAWAGPAPGGKRLEAKQLLASDPLLTLRAIERISVPVVGLSGEAPANLNALALILGKPAIDRISAAPSPAVRSVEALFRLWLHSLAAAVAGRRLAEWTGIADPQEAYMAALLHDLPAWSALCSAATGTLPPGILHWTRNWRMPESVQYSWQACTFGLDGEPPEDPTTRCVMAAEAIAILAGYPHPHSEGIEGGLLDDIPDEVTRRLLETCDRELETQLSRIHLPLPALRCPPTEDRLRALEDRDRIPPPPPFEEGIVRCLDLGASDRIRPVLTTLLAASCLYLDYDRSFFIQWIGKSRRLLIRSTFDRTAIRADRRIFVPSDHEAEFLGRVVGAGQPMVLERDPSKPHALLDHFGSKACLVVPLSGGSIFHGFLILDQEYSQRSPRPEDILRAQALAGVCAQAWTSVLLRRNENRSKRQAQTDPLTGLFNRRAAISLLEREIKRSERNRKPMAVLMLDLDHFKDMNDTYGHLAGDRILKKVGAILRSSLRGGDIPCRIGGEEFLVLQPETTVDESSLVATRIFTAVEQAGQAMQMPITISIGVTDLRPEDTIDTLLARADNALYASKELGRNRFSVDAD